jgi:hypothetical protein
MFVSVLAVSVLRFCIPNLAFATDRVVTLSKRPLMDTP